MQSRLAQPAAATSLPGPHVLVGRWGDISGCPRLRPFLPHLLWHGKGSWSLTQTEAGTSVSELEGSLVRMGQQRWREGWTCQGPAQ